MQVLELLGSKLCCSFLPQWALLHLRHIMAFIDELCHQNWRPWKFSSLKSMLATVPSLFGFFGVRQKSFNAMTWKKNFFFYQEIKFSNPPFWESEPFREPKKRTRRNLRQKFDIKAFACLLLSPKWQQTSNQVFLILFYVFEETPPRVFSPT